MLINLISSQRDIVTICDANLLGKLFEEGNFQLDIKESFFNGDKATEEDALRIINKMFKEDAIFNIVGEKSVNVAIKAGIASEENIKKIKGIPFLMVLM